MGISLWQVLIVVVLVFLLFGAGRLPRVMEDIAKGIKSFKKGISEDEDTSLDKPTEKITHEDKKG